MARDGVETSIDTAPLTAAMITFNEAHNIEAVLDNLRGFAREVLIVDSYSTDNTVELALAAGATVVQRRFRGFGDQWNFALSIVPRTQPWTMKIDPDERITPELKTSIRAAIEADVANGLILRRRLWFMGRPLPVRQDILRLWRTGECRFSDVAVNEHPIVSGPCVRLRGDLEHHDSPSLHHWFDKQNAYTTAEALQMLRGETAPGRLLGGPAERRAWLKRQFYRAPFRAIAMEFYCLIVQGAWRAGRVGFVWAKLRADLYRHVAYKLAEMRSRGEAPPPRAQTLGEPHPHVSQFE